MCLLPKIHPGITGIVDSYTQDADKLNEEQGMRSDCGFLP